MKEWKELFLSFWKNKYYTLSLCLTGLFSFGYLVTHSTVGIDDTPYLRYFEEGLSAIVGRWVMFLINKVFHVAEFAPFMTDLAGVLILMAAVTVWCTLMKKLFWEKIPMAGYILYACLFLSNPLHSEVFTYYLHNGVALGYLFCGIALCCFLEGISRKKLSGAWKPWLLSLLCLWIATGCYESFMVVYLVGVCIVLCSLLLYREKSVKVFPVLLGVLLIALLGMVLRSLTVSAVTALFGLEALKDDAVQRSVLEMTGWMSDPENEGLLGMILKRIFVMYGVFAYAYYPIRIYVIACLSVGIASVWMGIRRRSLWIPVLAVGSFAASYVLVLIEGKATLYRSAQFLPMFSAWGMMLWVFMAAGAGRWFGSRRTQKEKTKERKYGRKPERWLTAAAGVLLAAVVWNQCTDMNRWFYVDDMKYQSALDTVSDIASELQENFDTAKPVVFTGTYLVPQSVIEDAYVPYNSETFYKMKAITDRIDVHLLDKYYRDYGVWVAQTPSLSVIEWGREAFDSAAELGHFFAMHGYEIRVVEDWDKIREAKQAAVEQNLPSYPAEGSVVDVGEYIIVNF